MTDKEILRRYLWVQRDALASKLDEVSEYDVRRPQVTYENHHARSPVIWERFRI